MMKKARAESESTADLSEDDEFGIEIFAWEANLTRGDVYDRYLACSNAIIRFMEKQNNHEYKIQRALIAENVEPSVLETLPSLVKNYRVKAIVENNRLFITNLSSKDPHSTAVNSITKQVHFWGGQVDRFFGCRGDNVLSAGGRGSAPDIDIHLTKNNLEQPGDLGRIVIVEVEVNHRSIQQVREDYLRYFDYEPMVHTVIAISLYGTDQHPCLRAYAVQWDRGEGGIVVAEAFDFGLETISPGARAHFAQDGPNRLPSVPHAKWVTGRREPVTHNMLAQAGLDHLPPSSFLRAAHEFLMQPMIHHTDLYQGAASPPSFTVTGEVMGRYVQHLQGHAHFPVHFPDLILALSTLVCDVSRQSFPLPPLPPAGEV